VHLAALNKVEMLPWDEWGPMRGCYDEGVDANIELLMDAVAEACIAGRTGSASSMTVFACLTR
jgi:hypothetical protein